MRAEDAAMKIVDAYMHRCGMEKWPREEYGVEEEQLCTEIQVAIEDARKSPFLQRLRGVEKAAQEVCANAYDAGGDWVRIERLFIGRLRRAIHGVTT